jgi:hypothetical protein
VLPPEQLPGPGSGEKFCGNRAVCKGKVHEHCVKRLAAPGIMPGKSGSLPEKSLAIYSEKSSFKIDGCNIFVCNRHMFLA